MTSPAASHRWRLMLVGGAVLALSPRPLLSPLGDPWVVELVAWFGVALALCGLGRIALARRALAADRLVRVFTVAGTVAGPVGALGRHRVLLVVGFSLLLAAACRAGMSVGIDVQRAVLRRLER